MERTIEQKVASAILEKNVSEIEIDAQTYAIAPPTLATLILVSEIISTLPIVEKVDITDNKQKEQIVTSVLHNARFYKSLGDIAAVLILGAKNLTQTVETEQVKKRFFGLFGTRTVKRTETVDRKRELAQKILDNVRPSVLFRCVIERLRDMEIADFFLITTSLSEANLLKPTKEVVR